MLKTAPKKKTKKPTLTSVGRRLDTLARDICKLEANFTCQRCGAVGDSSSIEWAHIEPRRKKALRWSQMNCLALCNSKINNCHRWFDNTRIAPVKWLMENFPEKVEWLEEEEEGIDRASMTTKDTVEDRLVLEGILKEIRTELEKK